MASAAKNGKIVLENRLGQVVRTFNADASTFTLIRREDSGRVEGRMTLTDLEQTGINYTVLAQVNKAQVQKAPMRLADGSNLKWVEDIKLISPRHELDADHSNEEFKQIIKWTLGANVGLLLLALAIHAIFPPADQQQEEHVVQIVIPEERQAEPKRKRVTVKAAKHKIVKHKQKVRAVTKPKTKVARIKPRTHTAKRPKSFGHTRRQRVVKGGANVDQMGALSVLGGRSKAPVTGGSLNLKHVQFKEGSGGGGTGRAGHGGYGGGGRGGFSNALAGKGLLTASRGTGDVGLPSGGYGTRGKAGGSNGYGRANLRGGNNGYFQPLDQEAEIEGGLDRDQIDEVIQKNIGQIRYCYERGLQSKPALAGRVGIRFVINSRGRVSIANVARSSMNSSQVEGCIVRKLRGFRFPHPVGGVNVKVLYPFQFGRQSDRHVSQR